MKAVIPIQNKQEFIKVLTQLIAGGFVWHRGVAGESTNPQKIVSEYYKTWPIIEVNTSAAFMQGLSHRSHGDKETTVAQAIREMKKVKSVVLSQNRTAYYRGGKHFQCKDANIPVAEVKKLYRIVHELRNYKVAGYSLVIPISTFDIGCQRFTLDDLNRVYSLIDN